MFAQDSARDDGSRRLHPTDTAVAAYRHVAPVSTLWAITLLALGACADQQDPLVPQPTGGPNRSRLSQPYTDIASVPPAAAGTLRDEFSAMARRVPGGFGGLYFDKEGVLNILLTDPERASEARAALAQERFVQARTAGPGGERFDLAHARITRGVYSHDQLQRWLDHILREFAGTPTMSGIRVHKNKVLLGVSDGTQQEEVLRIVQAVGIPDDAVIVEVSPTAVPLTTLTDRIRPVPAGVQVRNSASGRPWCSLGPNLLWITWQDSTRSFLVASHCTKEIFSENDTTLYWQPVYTDGTSNHIGNEVRDPALFECDENPAHGCRNSDAALGHYASYATYELGYIARPASRNSGTLTLDASAPRFEIVGQFNWAVDGEVMEKVGRTTGWTGGSVVDGCITMQVSDAPYHSIRCSMLVDAEAGSGDSGAPVFKIESGTEVKIRGTLYAGYGPEGNSCTVGVDPVYQVSAVYCPQFLASNLGGIKMDLDPNNNAQLRYW